jgi:hypothetical protein
VGQAPFHADNHFVPSVYLRHFLNDSGKIAIYRTLVSHLRDLCTDTRRENEEEFHAEESWWKNYPTQQAALELSPG